MAVFILKAEHGICYTPPACTGVFPDVPCTSSFAPWIEAMAAEGITSGCGGGNFCPLDPVRRDQMAVFLLKGEHGASYVPPPCAGIFTDVPCPGPVRQLDRAAQGGGRHERLRHRNHVLPLERQHARPDGRLPGQDLPTILNMAVFIVETFNLR